MFQSQPTVTIGFMSPYLGGVFFGAVLAGAQQAAHRLGMKLIVMQASPQDVYRSQLALDIVDGWIAVMDTSGIEQFTQSGVPVVLISATFGDLPAVIPDNYSGTLAAVRHLIGHGHKQIAFVGHLANSDIQQRLQGYRAALAERNLPFDERLVVDAENELELAGFDATRRLIESGQPFTAIVTGTDKNAFGALEAAHLAGRRVPEDLALVGFDDVAQAQTVEPPLTTVRQRFDTLGGNAIKQLRQLLAGQTLPPGPVYVPTALIPRRSCGCDNAENLPTEVLIIADDITDWRDTLAHQLVRLLLYPFQPETGMPPTTIWPGCATLIGALDTALQDGDSPAVALIEAAWQEAIGISADLDVLNTACDLIERAAWQQLAGAMPNPATRARLISTLQIIRRELMRIRVGSEDAQVTYLDSIVYANNEISTAMLADIGANTSILNWLRHTPAAWGCMGLWTDPAHPTTLKIISIYSRVEQSAQPIGSEIAAVTFPLDQRLAAPSDICILVPIETTRRRWGVLAIAGITNTGITWNSDPIAMWGDLLGAALDRNDLLAELQERQEALAAQQATLQAAYERERALASTIREIGSPVIPLMPGVLLIPLIGAIDTDRAQQIIKAGLDTISQEHATDLLIDVSAVPLIDTQVASALIRMARMSGLLGARTMLVGVRPEIAQSIVGLGIDLQHIETAPTLAAALDSLRKRRTSSAVRQISSAANGHTKM